MTDSRQTFVEWATWFANNKETHPFNYTEGPLRMSAIGQWPIKFPVNADCSAFVTFCAWLSGMTDPNGLSYNHEGYTGTLLGNVHNGHIPQVDVEPGDIVVYGATPGEHTAIIVEKQGANLLTVSHGEQGDPSFVWVNYPEGGNPNNYPTDGREPQTFLRLQTAVVGTVRLVPAVITSAEGTTEAMDRA